MREIKFRAKVADSDYENEKQTEMIGSFVHFTGFIGLENDIGYVEQLEEINGVGWFDVDLKTLGQYTGLKDKDDKEIYEGDIVLLKNEFATWKGTVVFEEGAFKFLIKHSWGTSVEHFNKTNVLNDMGARIQLNNIYLVVGNIYENPELLGDSK